MFIIFTRQYQLFAIAYLLLTVMYICTIYDYIFMKIHLTFALPSHRSPVYPVLQ